MVIKANSKCAKTKLPLQRGDYVQLPPTFGLNEGQRNLCYDIFLKYEEWRKSQGYWDQTDRVSFVLRHGPSVYREEPYMPWTDRVNQRGENDLVDKDGSPRFPFFYDIVCADEAQDFSELDLVLFARMSSNIRSLFFSADGAQSVELGISMRDSTVNDVMYSLIGHGHTVKDVLQQITLLTNHRTHSSNLAIGQAIRRILARSFKLPLAEERALINGTIPKFLRIKNINELADSNVFSGGNVIFLAPDDRVHSLRVQFRELGIQNDIFGVVEAKGLEFDSVALVGFFEYYEQRGSSDVWMNSLRWLSSSSSITKTGPSGEVVAGVMLEDCMYTLSHPELSDEAMMLYTALTRARNQIYLVEAGGKSKTRKKSSLADYAFRRLSDLGLAKSVSSIDEGQAEMTPAQHKARGVMLVAQALNMARSHAPFIDVRRKFMEAKERFSPIMGNDVTLLKKSNRHFRCLEKKQELVQFVRDVFFVNGEYNLEGLFAEVLQFEEKMDDFFSRFLGDSFLAEEVKEVRCLVQEVFLDTPYEVRFKGIFQKIESLESFV